jgi:hypothetical protein
MACVRRDSQTSEFPDHLRRTALHAGFRDLGATLVVRQAVVEDLPDQPTEPVRNGSNGLSMPEADHEPSINERTLWSSRPHAQPDSAGGASDDGRWVIDDCD